jgi:hypothetical protein
VIRASPSAVPAAAVYCTIKVSFVLWVNVVEPAVAPADTVIVYVPAWVPVTTVPPPPPPELPPPQDASVIPRLSANTSVSAGAQRRIEIGRESWSTGRTAKRAGRNLGAPLSFF